MKQPRESKSPSAMVRLPLALVDRMNAIKPMARRVVWVERAFEVIPLPPASSSSAGNARAVSAPPEPLVEASAAEAETKVKVALRERGVLASGSPDAGSPSVLQKTVWSTGRNGLGDATQWAGAVVHLPVDCLWFLSLDDDSRAAAVRASLARARDVAGEREERLAALSNPEGHARPSVVPESWEPVVVWVPAKEACYPSTIQEVVAQGLGVEKQLLRFDLEGFLAEEKAKKAKPTPGGAA